MSADLRLGVRLARCAGRARRATILGCTAFGVALVVLIAQFPTAAQPANSLMPRENRLALQLLALGVTIPVVVMVGTVNRLSSDTRDRRLATLRLLGLTPGRVGIVAAIESTVLVGAGALLGVALAQTVITPLGRTALRHGWIQQMPAADLTMGLGIALLVIAGAALAAVRPAMRTGVAMLSATRTRAAGRWPGRVCAALGCLGLVTALWLALRTFDSEQRQRPLHFQLLGLSLLLLAVGVVSVSGYVISGAATVLSRTRSATGTVCAARLRGDRANLGRALAGLVIATFASTIGLCVFAAWVGTPQYTSTQWAATHTTSALLRVNSGSLSSATRAVSAMDGVQGVVPAGLSYGTNGEQVVSMSCAQVTAWANAPGCSDDQVWVANDNPSNDRGARSVRLQEGNRAVTITPWRSVALDDLMPANSWGLTWLSDSTIVVPPAIWNRLGLQPNAVLFAIAPGSRVLDRFMADAPFTFGGQISVDWAAYDQVRAMRRLTLILVGCVIAVGLLAVVVATLDLLAERRRAVAALRIVGVPLAVLRRSQFGAVLIPLLGGVVVATGAGWTVGRAYLNLYGQPALTPLRDLSVLLAVMISLGTLLAAATTVGLGRPLTADLIRRE